MVGASSVRGRDAPIGRIKEVFLREMHSKRLWCHAWCIRPSFLVPTSAVCKRFHDVQAGPDQFNVGWGSENLKIQGRCTPNTVSTVFWGFVCEVSVTMGLILRLCTISQYRDGHRDCRRKYDFAIICQTWFCIVHGTWVDLFNPNWYLPWTYAGMLKRFLGVCHESMSTPRKDSLMTYLRVLRVGLSWFVNTPGVLVIFLRFRHKTLLLRGSECSCFVQSITSHDAPRVPGMKAAH